MPPGDPPPGEVGQRIRFAGSGSEYFRIWIVNLLLTLVTLGIYAPWAKVRRQQYFHRNTYLADSPFDYHGRPLAILLGRVVSLLMLGVYANPEIFTPAASLAAMGLILLLLPFLLQRSLRFRLRNTSWRNLRFGFGGTVGQAYRTAALPLVLVAALAAAVVVADGFDDGSGEASTEAQAEAQTEARTDAPADTPADAAGTGAAAARDEPAQGDAEAATDADGDAEDTTADQAIRRQLDTWLEALKANWATVAAVVVGVLLAVLLGITSLAAFAFTAYRRYAGNHARFGSAAFALALRTRDVFAVYLRGVLLWSATVVVPAALVALLAVPTSGGDVIGLGIAMMFLPFAIGLAGYLGVWAVQGYVTSRLMRLVWNRTRLGRHRFVCDLSARRYALLLVGNLLLTVASLGLYRPFAAVASARMRLESIRLVTIGPFDEVLARVDADARAVGDEFADALDLDLSF